MANLETLARLVRDLGAERAAAVSHVERLRQQRDALDSDPLPRADLQRQVERYIDAQLVAFDANLRAALQHLANRPNLRIEQLQHGFPLLQAMHGSGGLDERLIVALVADAAKARARKVISAMDWPEFGPPAAERDGLRVQLDEQIAVAEAALAEINGGLAEMGVSLEASRG